VTRNNKNINDLLLLLFF